MTAMTFRSLTRADVRPAAEVLGRALHQDPFFKAIAPGEKERRPILIRQMAGAIRYSLHHGLVEACPNLEAVAVWLPPGRTHVDLGRMTQAGPAALWDMMSMPPKAMRRAMPFRKPMDDLHRRVAPGPHWYLWILGVDPRYQRQGLGTRLVHHRFADIDGSAIYLETARRVNVSYYERLGFEAVDLAKIPEMGVTFWGMLRPTQPEASA